MKPGAGLISFLLDLSPGPFHLSRHAAIGGQDLAPPGFLWGSFPPTISTSPKIGKLVADALGSRHEGNGSLESCKVGYSTRIFEASKSPAMKSGRESDGPFLKALMIKYRNVWDPQLQPSLLLSSGDLEAACCLQDGPQCIVKPSGHRLAKGRWSKLHPVLESC